MPALSRNSETRLLGELPSHNRTEKIEVSTRTAEDGSTVLDLVEYSWGSGLGWYVQKRMTLDADQFEALRALLAPESAPAIPSLRRTLPPVECDGNVTRILFE